ncbi:MAG: hypothetical protein K1X63_12290, partial [Chitinophagales bacterium]|nr:hypothetical protein [Chitinophagales bacterium]
MGAWELSGIAADFVGPTISYTALSNTGCTNAPSLSATISDASGVNITSGTAPRLYYKKSTDANAYVGNTSADNGWKYVETSSTSSPYSFLMNGSLLQSPIANGDVIQYFVVAQDLAGTPNVSINSGTFAAAPASVALTGAAFPIGGSINSYSVLNAVNTSVTIGAAGDYASLTGASGLFNAINTGSLSGPTTATIIDASVTETGAVALNQIAYGCSGAVTLTIKPQSTATLTGSVSSGALVKLNGADNVIIDGSNSNGTDRSLTITNTATTAPSVISLISLGTGAGATNNVIKNCNINTGVATTLGYGISVGGSTPGTSGADNDNVTIQNNNITVVPIAIYANGTASSSTGGNDNLLIASNSVDYNNTSTGLATIGIQVGNALNSSVTQNTLSEQTSASQSPTAISLETGFVSSSVTKNNITKSVTTNTGGYGGRGIAIGTNTASSNLTIANNFISGVNGTNWSSFGNSSSMGIVIGAVGNSSTLTTTTGGVNLYYNTVNMYGSYSSSTSCLVTALYVGSGATALDIRDNIFTNSINNTGTGTSAKAYSIYSAAANTAFSNINYNDYSVSGTQGVLGFIGSDRTDLAGIQAGFGGNLQSQNIAPVFTSSTDLHLPPSSNVSLNNLGTNIAGITTDIDGDNRDGSNPDMGADEYIVATCSGAAGGNGAGSTTICSGNSATITASGYSTGLNSSYQWEYSNDNFATDIHDLSGQTNPASANTGTLNATTYFRLRVSCSTNASTDYSTVVTITVNPTPSASITPGGPVNSCTANLTQLSAVTNGTSPSYQWILNGTDISGQTSSTYTPGASGSYTVRVTSGGCSATSTAVAVTVNQSPTGVTAQAAPTSLCEGGTINLTSSYDASSLGTGMGAYSATRTTGTSFTSIIPATTITSWRATSSITDDNLSDNQPIGFTFNYNGVAYTDFRVSTNGFITFNTTSSATGGGTGAYGYSNNWTVTSGGLMVAPNWDDLQTAGNLGTTADLDNSINYTLIGAPGSYVLTVEWKNMQDFSTSSTASYNFQVKLYQSDNHIEFVYGTMTQSATSTSYSLGLSAASVSATPTAAELLSQTTANTSAFGFTNQNSLTPVPASNTTISFTLPTPTYSWTGPNSFSSSAANPSITSATTAASGVYNLVVTNSATGCSSTSASTANVTVSANVTYYADADGDTYGDPSVSQQSCTGAPSGYVLDNTDCNDGNIAVYPGATEVCNGIDDDCDTQIDEGVQNTYYADTDNDGYGSPGSSTQACTAPSGYVSDNTDCNDGDINVNPGATEVCNTIDDDCDFLIDEGVQSTFYADADGDGFGDLAVTTTACSAPSGYVSNSLDCDDTQYLYADGDGDGYGAGAPVACGVSSNNDCNDGNINVHPGATEVCNGIDDDCANGIDDGLTFTTYYADADGDGYGAGTGASYCSNPGTGYSLTNTDCNDGDINVNPGATEVCNGIDDDCANGVDDGLTFTTYYADADGDGYGAGSGTSYCSNPGAGYSLTNTDCNDGDINVNPGATEVCNGIDDDCANGVDDGLTFTTYYADGDGDGYGAGSGTSYCSNPGAGYSLTNDDCNDGNAGINPAATEICGNAIDDNCNTLVDDGCTQFTFYADADGDSYGDPGHDTTVFVNTPPVGFVTNNTDCNDGNASVNPGATEVCNGIDDDCDTQIDEGVQNTYYADNDNDGYGAGSAILACTQPAGTSTNNSDCNDGSGAINPGAQEICNSGVDDDCDGLADDADPSVTGQGTYYADADGDGYGAGAAILACVQPANTSVNNTDCNDGVGAINPGATEVCNGIDDDCANGVDDGLIFTTYYADADGDGYGAGTGTSYCSNPGAGYSLTNNDCNDGNAAVNPGATEVCNGIDDDCANGIDDGLTFTTYYADADGDGYGAGSGTSYCSNPGAGYSLTNNDCNDGNAAVNPAATEVCNGIDDNCANGIDDGLTFTTYY